MLFKVSTLLAVVALMGAVSAHRNGRGRNRGYHYGAGATAQPLDCDEEESFACGTRRLGDVPGTFACRTITPPWGGEARNETVCLDAATAATADDACGCCEGVCPTACPCVCGDDGAGFWVEPIGGSRFGHRELGRAGGGRFRDDGDIERDALQVLVCAPQLRALTAVATGSAECSSICEI